jgi:hypothetical protein
MVARGHQLSLCHFRHAHPRTPNPLRRPISVKIWLATIGNRHTATPLPLAGPIPASTDSSQSLGWPETHGLHGEVGRPLIPIPAKSGLASPSPAIYGAMERGSTVDNLSCAQISRIGSLWDHAHTRQAPREYMKQP